MWQIDVTSALTHNISGTAKACAQTVIALQWKDESKVIVLNSNVLIMAVVHVVVEQRACAGWVVCIHYGTPFRDVGQVQSC